MLRPSFSSFINRQYGNNRQYDQRGRAIKVCIDARSPGYSGILNYATCLIRHLAALDERHEYVVLRTPRDTPWDIAGVEERILPSDNPAHWYLWSNTRLPDILAREAFDLYHSLKHITMLRGKTKKLVTFHSSRFLIHPEHYRRHEAAYWRIMSPIAARRYDAVIAVSQAEKRNYVERMGAREELVFQGTRVVDREIGYLG